MNSVQLIVICHLDHIIITSCMVMHIDKFPKIIHLFIQKSCKTKYMLSDNEYLALCNMACQYS